MEGFSILSYHDAYFDFIGIIVTASVCDGQGFTATDSVIRGIRAEYAAINAAVAAGRMRVTEKDLWGLSSEGGTEYYYSHGVMIRWLDGDKKVVPPSKYPEQTKTLLELWKAADENKE